jgi:putative transposase
MHAKAYGSQAKGAIERPNATIWDVLAKRFPTYIGGDMDKEAGQKIHKITRRELREFGESRHLPGWEEFVRLAWAMVEEYNNKPHAYLPKFEDPATGKRRHMSPNESWAAHVANGFEPVSVDPDEADDLFRPYEVRTASRSQVWWNTNEYFHPALEAYHGKEVMVGYDYHQADRVWVREFDRSSGQPGRLICVAAFGGNRTRYVPLTYEQKAVEDRAKGRLRRLDAKRDRIEAEREAMPMIDHQPGEVANFIDLAPTETKAVPLANENAAPTPVAPRRRVFRSDEELAAWALQNPSELSKNQIAVLRECLASPSARELFRMSGIDTEALRTLLRAAA